MAGVCSLGNVSSAQSSERHARDRMGSTGPPLAARNQGLESRLGTRAARTRESGGRQGGRVAYSAADDEAMKKWVASHPDMKTQGKKLWKAAERAAITRHSWASMQNRWRRGGRRSERRESGRGARRRPASSQEEPDRTPVRRLSGRGHGFPSHCAADTSGHRVAELLVQEEGIQRHGATMAGSEIVECSESDVKTAAAAVLQYGFRHIKDLSAQMFRCTSWKVFASFSNSDPLNDEMQPTCISALVAKINPYRRKQQRAWSLATRQESRKQGFGKRLVIGTEHILREQYSTDLVMTFPAPNSRAKAFWTNLQYKKMPDDRLNGTQLRKLIVEVGVGADNRLFNLPLHGHPLDGLDAHVEGRAQARLSRRRSSLRQSSRR